MYIPKSNPALRCLITILLVVLVSLTPQIIYSADSFKSGQLNLLNDNPTKLQVTRNIASMPLAFTENQGQWDEKVKFRANAGGATMWFSPDGAYYQFTRRIEKEPYSIVDKRYQMEPDLMDLQSDSIETMMIKANFVGANLNPQMVGVEMMEYKCNYFIGNDPNEWHTDVPNYTAVLYEQVYDGIDLKYYGNGKQMEYDFIVEPGADFSQIKIQYEGAESISVNANGELVVETKWGEVIEQRPVIYQIENDARIPVEGNYKLQSDNSFGFELGSYNSALPLIIDPVLAYSTYLGGSNDDISFDIAIDAFGNAYITGYTKSTNFPTVGAYQENFGGTLRSDVFVTKLNSNGNGLVYSTYLGGSGEDFGVGIALDSFGNAYITGATASTNFPIEVAYQPISKGGNSWDDHDVFVTKLNSNGNGLVYSTYLGGSSSDRGEEIAVDGSGNAYVTGKTSSTDFPTEGAYQSNHGGSTQDVFVTKLNNSGNALVFSTYLGGSSDDSGEDIVVDGSGNVYVTGTTFSTDFPIEGAYQSNHGGGNQDVFVTKLNNSGNTLVYSTYLGGSDRDRQSGIAIDDFGNVYITGQTMSADFPTTEGAYQVTQPVGLYNAFVTKLNSVGNGLVYSTYLGGNGQQSGNDIKVDDFGNAYIIGQTGSTDFPTSEGAFQENHQGGGWDVFLTKINTNGNGLLYSTYIGGSDADGGNGIVLDGSGNVYITGATSSTDFPMLNPYQGTYQGGNNDVFVTKFIHLGCCVGVRGNADGDIGDKTDVDDLVYMVDFAFNGGDPVVCLEEGDVDASGIIDVDDLVFMVDFAFKGGPAPGDCP